MTEWNFDMDAAPRDGSWFVIAVRWGGNEMYEVGAYDPSTFDRYEPEGDGLYRKTTEQLYEWSGFNNFESAIAWCKLPDAPKEQEQNMKTGNPLGNEVLHDDK